MKRKEILALARGSGMENVTGSKTSFFASDTDILRLVDKIRAATKEEDAKICDRAGEPGLGYKYQGDVFAAAIRGSK